MTNGTPMHRRRLYLQLQSREICELFERHQLPLPGRHNILNALAAAAVADFYGMPLTEIASALAAATLPNKRGNLIRLANDVTVIDDSYNSNPRALAEMVETFCATECKRRIVVAGEMLELGPSGAGLHRDAGRRISPGKVDLLIGVHGLAREIVEGAREIGFPHDRAVFCESADEAAESVIRVLRAGDWVLVKGSRGVRMEAVVERIRREMGE